MNSINLSFWSGSRSSVKSTRRNAFHRARSAAMDGATPTFSSRVKSRSRTDAAVSILSARLRLTLANPPLDVKPIALATSCLSKCHRRNQRLAGRAEIGAKHGPCYTSRFPMSAKSQQGKKSHRKITGPQMVAHAALPTRYGRFTLYGFRGRGPQEEAVALVRGNLNGKTAPLVRLHSHCLTGHVLGSRRSHCRPQLEFSVKRIRQ